MTPDITRLLARHLDELITKLDTSCVRWLRPGNVHLTVKFLGQIEEGIVSRLKAALESAALTFGPFGLTLEGVGGFPDLRRPRVVWIGIHDGQGAMRELHGIVEEQLEALGFDRERRPFQPHLTLGRARRDATEGQLRALGAALQTFELEPLGVLEVEGLSLMQSILKPSGAIYRRLHYAPLRGGR